ncbi:MAG: hypothetical protein Sapg2KO_17640 [Saprospiraceae bacterium]
MEYQTLNKKGKLSTTMRQEIKSVQQDGNSIKANLVYQMKDKKGKEIFAGDSQITCNGESLLIDISAMLPEGVKSMAATGEVTMEGDGFIIPNSLKVGDQLSDSKNNIKIDMSGINMNIPVEMTNIKIESEEEITTPAGTFKALKMTYDSYSKAMMMKVEGKVINWFAKGIGNIKTESYDKNGRLVSVQELTKLEK